MAAEDWEGFREATKQRKDEKRSRNEKALWLLHFEGYKVTWGEYRARVEDKLDIFTTSGKYHDLKNNKRGQVKGSLVNFVKEFLHRNK